MPGAQITDDDRVCKAVLPIVSTQCVYSHTFSYAHIYSHTHTLFLTRTRTHTYTGTQAPSPSHTHIQNTENVEGGLSNLTRIY